MENYRRMIDILTLLPKEQGDKVFSQRNCDIEPDFVGFTDQYYHLSQIIPKHWTVVDLGCAYNPQCFYFTEHKEYVAVDVSDCVKFQAPNCKIFVKSIRKFIEEDLSQFKLSQTFAICQYVPPWSDDNIKLAREAFPNVFTYYPCSDLNYRSK